MRHTDTSLKIPLSPSLSCVQWRFCNHGDVMSVIIWLMVLSVRWGDSYCHRIMLIKGGSSSFIRSSSSDQLRAASSGTSHFTPILLIRFLKFKLLWWFTCFGGAVCVCLRSFTSCPTQMCHWCSCCSSMLALLHLSWNIFSIVTKSTWCLKKGNSWWVNIKIPVHLKNTTDTLYSIIYIINLIDCFVSQDTNLLLCLAQYEFKTKVFRKAFVRSSLCEVMSLLSFMWQTGCYCRLLKMVSQDKSKWQRQRNHPPSCLGILAPSLPSLFSFWETLTVRSTCCCSFFPTLISLLIVYCYADKYIVILLVLLGSACQTKVLSANCMIVT